MDKEDPLPTPDPIESSKMVHAFIIEHNWVTGLKISGSTSVPSKELSTFRICCESLGI